jgi:hypothetical protein
MGLMVATLSDAAIYVVRASDFSKLLYQRDDRASHLLIADLAKRFGQSDAFPRWDKLVNEDCLTWAGVSGLFCMRCLKEEIWRNL